MTRGKVIEFEHPGFIPRGDAIEDNSDAAWREWDRASQPADLVVSESMAAPQPPNPWRTEIAAALLAAGIYDPVRHAEPRAALADLIAYHTR